MFSIKLAWVQGRLLFFKSIVSDREECQLPGSFFGMLIYYRISNSQK